uniref:uncharacterized protein LOC101304378 n=1 Tax=Fragaria vesca subsp. vesca TaxID=101020 RepID=UPI0005C85CA5|nr:PREDICTED: uncharacterized protein LOC101304378 [Fragaria vesca subsp. vesca]
MQDEGLSPLPESIPQVQVGRQGEMEETLRAIRDSVASLADRISNAERRGAHNPTRASFEERRGPFTRAIIRSVRPSAAKPLKLSYNGDRDPHLFLDSFKSHMKAKGYSDAICCNMFQETLEGEALSWFYKLPSNLIDCFRELADKFVNRFILRTDGQNTAQLFKVKQDRGEGLKAFVNRWQGAMARVRNFDKKVAEEAFIQGLLLGKFIDLDREDEGRRARRRIACTSGLGDKGLDGEQEPNSHPAGKRHKGKSWGKAGKQHNAQGKTKGPYQDTGYARTAPASNEHFLVLNATYEVIWNENKSAIPPPPTRKFPPSRLTKEDTGKFCGYHGEASHNINSCIELKKAVERWIQEEKLQQYVPWSRHVGAIEVYETINTIHGGSRIDNRSNKTKKQCTGSRDGREVFAFGSSSNQQVTTGWKSVTFLEEEKEGIRPHEDPFLITLQLDHYITKKILVDTGASVNVLFRSAWKGLHRGSNKLIQDHEPLISFSGDVVQPLGSDSFGVSMEGREGIARATVEFIVVDCESSYNGILGRPALWKLKSFVAGHMLMMKVPTPTGVITIWGDQAVARSCYAIDNGRKRSEVLLASQAMASPSDPYVDPRDDTDSDEERPGSTEETEMVSVSDEFPDRQVTIGTGQAPGVRAALKTFLKKNSGAFAWTYKDMPGISSGIVTH